MCPLSQQICIFETNMYWISVLNMDNPYEMVCLQIPCTIQKYQLLISSRNNYVNATIMDVPKAPKNNIYISAALFNVSVLWCIMENNVDAQRVNHQQPRWPVKLGSCTGRSQQKDPSPPKTGSARRGSPKLRHKDKKRNSDDSEEEDTAATYVEVDSDITFNFTTNLTTPHAGQGRGNLLRS